MIRTIYHGLIGLLCIFLTNGCGQGQTDERKPLPLPLKESAPELQIERFEKDLFESRIPLDTARVRFLANKYGDFFELWCVQLAMVLPPGRGKPSEEIIAFNLNQYVQDKYIREVYTKSQEQFADLDWLQKDLGQVWQRYREGFPGRIVPTVITYLSPFSSNVMAMDSLLGVGLHFYFGQDYKYYPTLQLPGYMIRKMERAYIVSDLLRGWLESEFFTDSVEKNCLSQMIFQGKILFASEVIAPEMPDTIRTGYSQKQLEWTNENEANIWSFFIEQEMLYKTNPKVYLKYIHDGNTTSGFPKEAPARLGGYIGWQIVRSYMQTHPEVTLEQLFKTNDAQFILANSGYKPPKPS